MRAYTVEQVAEMLHVGRDKVYYLLRTGQLRSIKIGKLRRITEQQLAEFIASLEDAARLVCRDLTRISMNGSLPMDGLEASDKQSDNDLRLQPTWRDIHRHEHRPDLR